MPKTANDVARNNGKNSFATVIFNSIKSQRGVQGWRGQVFICRFTKARVHTFFHLDRFQDAFSSRSSVAREGKKKKGCRRGAFSFRIHLGAYRRAPPQDAFRSLSLLPEERKKGGQKDSVFSHSTRRIYLRGSFFSTYSWRA